MLIRSKPDILASEITQPAIFEQRRSILKALLSGSVAASGILPGVGLAMADSAQQILTPTPIKLVKNYTNYYEFGFNKEDASRLADKLTLQPWTIEISGEVEKPLTFNVDELISKQAIQEYIYRFRCVEGWSMVVPWQGFSLQNLLKQIKPLSSANFVKFTSVAQPEAMPMLAKKAMLDWPYVEALRIDEAAHPLTILATGMYGAPLSKQNGAPLRLVVPWKYGFKSIKAIVKIELLKRPPLTSWNKFAPDEYGFYANVNPNVPHPRWSQASERALGSDFFTARRQTELFNGYAAQVAGLYRDMDLTHFI